MISIITSTYQRPEKLKRAIESVQNQTYKDYEHIIVSDGEDEATKAVVEAYNDPQIRFYEIPHFGNPSRPRNKGLMEAKGEYVCFLDDDNAFRPDHLNILLKALEQDPSLALTYGDRWIIDESGQNEPQLGVFADFDPLALFNRNYIDTSDVLVKKEALTYLGGWDERFKKYLDWELWIRLVKAGYKFKRVPLVITDYYIHQDTMSNKTLDTKGMNLPAWDPQNVEIRLPFLGTIPEPKVAVFSITYERLDYTKQAFASLFEKAGYPFDLYVVDNGSKDGTVDFLTSTMADPKFSMTCLFNPDNKGISIASNQALEMILAKGYDVIVKYDNDCISQTSGWLAKMVDLYKSNHRLALSCYVNGLRDNPGGAQRFSYGELKKELIGMTRHLGGICHFVSKDAYEKFRWPEDDTLHGMQDLYFSNFLLAQGYQMGYLENYYVSHGPTGTAGQYQDYQDYFERRKKEKTIKYDQSQ